MITLEQDLTRVSGVRASALAVILNRLTTCDETRALAWVAPGRLPRTLLPNHRIRIRDARARRAAPFVR